MGGMGHGGVGVRVRRVGVGVEGVVSKAWRVVQRMKGGGGQVGVGGVTVQRHRRATETTTTAHG